MIDSHSVNLTNDEMLLLDGRCSATVQAKIDILKESLSMALSFPELSAPLSQFVGKVVAAARVDEALRLIALHILRCDLCGSYPNPEYEPYKSGGNKGLPNRSKPRYLRGVELSAGRFRMTNFASLGCCVDCWATVKAAVIAALVGVPCQLPEPLRTEGAPAWVRSENCECKVCGHIGCRADLKPWGTCFQCPSCETKDDFRGAQHFKITAGYTLKVII
jgi:hypothetical protein